MPNKIVVDIENRSGTKQGPGPIATVLSLEYSDALSRAGEFSFTMPARDTRAANLALKTTCVRIFDNNAQVFLGIVESLTKEVDDRGVGVLRVAGRNMLAELAEQSVGNLSLASSSAKVTSGPGDVIALASGWALDTSPVSPLTGYSTSSNGVYARFAWESCLQALNRLHEVTGENFLTSDEDRKIVWIRDNWPDSGVRAIQGGADPVGLAANTAVCVIQNLQQVQEAHELVNKLFPFGSGEGDARLTIAASSYADGAYLISGSQQFYLVKGSNYIQRSYSGYAYSTPDMERAVQFGEITPISNTDTDLASAADMLCDAAFRYLEWYGDPQTFYSLDVLSLPATVRPGMTVRVIYDDAALSVDANLKVIEVQRQIKTDGSRTARLLVSSVDRWPTSDEDEIVGQMMNGVVRQAHQQMGPGTWTISYREELDENNQANLYFWLGEEIAQVSQIILRFRVDPLRSTVRTVAGSSTSSGASSTSSSASESSHTHTTPSHYHNTTIVDGSAFTLVANVNLYTSGGIYYLGRPSGGSSLQVTTVLTGEGGTTSAAGASHTHNIDHTHTFTPSITTTYGIYEAASANTYGHSGGVSTLAQIKTDLALAVGGVDRVASAVDAGTTGWFEIDVTQWLANTTTFRPNSEANLIWFSRKTATTGKTAMIVAQLQIRAIIQSVAYS